MSKLGLAPPQPPRILYLRDLLRLFLDECFFKGFPDFFLCWVLFDERRCLCELRLTLLANGLEREIPNNFIILLQ